MQHKTHVLYPIIVLFISFTASISFGAISEHILYVELEQTWDYGNASDPNLYYAFEFTTETDDTVDYIAVLAPGGKEIIITESEYCDDYGGWWKFEYDFHVDDPAELSDFGDGNYTMTVYYKDSSSEQTMIEYSGLVQPTQEPVPVFPAPGQQAVSPVQFQWEPCTDPAPNNIWFDVENAEGEEVIDTIDVTPGTTGTGVVDLATGSYTAVIGFENSQSYTNSDGIYVSRWKTSCIEWDFSVRSAQIIDIAPAEGDGHINLADFAVLADGWLDACGSPNNWCNGADFDTSGQVDISDLDEFIYHWLDDTTVSDHVFGIYIENGLDYESSDTPDDDTYDFDMGIMTDETVVSVAFTTPAGNTFTIPCQLIEESMQPDGFRAVGREYDDEDGMYEWRYEYEFYHPDPLDAYGDGAYIVTATCENGLTYQTTAWFGIPGTDDAIPQPTQQPVYTSFSDGDTVTSPVTFNWLLCTDPNAIWIWFDLESENEEDVEIDLPTSATGLDEPLDLNPGLWEAYLGFATYYVASNSDGIIVDVAKYTESDYDIGVLDNIADHVFEIDIENALDYESPDTSSDDTFDFELAIITDATVVSVEFITPAGNSFSIPYDDSVHELPQADGFLTLERLYEGPDRYEWNYEYEFFNQSSLADYGDGTYTIIVTYQNGLTDQTTFSFSIPGTSDPLPQPTQMPQLTTLTNGQVVSSPISVAWQPCTDLSAQLIYFEYEHTDFEIEDEFYLDVNQTGLDEPLVLSAGTYEIWHGFASNYIFANSDGITIDAAKYSESDYEIIVE